MSATQCDLNKWVQLIRSEWGPSDPYARLVLLNLSYWMKRYGPWCWVSRKRQRLETGLADSTIRNRIAAAAGDGWLLIGSGKAKGQTCKTYAPAIPDNLPEECRDTAPLNEKGCRTTAPPNERGVPPHGIQGCRATAWGGDATRHPNGRKNDDPNRERAPIKTEVPNDFTPTERHRKLAQEKGLAKKVEDYARAFVLWHKANGTKYRDWNIAFELWLEREKDFPCGDAQEGKPDWARMPEQDDALETWAVEHGYPRPPRGMQTYSEYRSLLRQHIEERIRDGDSVDGRGGKSPYYRPRRRSGAAILADGCSGAFEPD